MWTQHRTHRGGHQFGAQVRSSRPELAQQEAADRHDESGGDRAEPLRLNLQAPILRAQRGADARAQLAGHRIAQRSHMQLPDERAPLGQPCAALVASAQMRQLIAGARQPRHHGTDRAAGDAGDLPVRHGLEFPQDEHFALLDRQSGDSQAQTCALVLGHDRGQRILRARVGGAPAAFQVGRGVRFELIQGYPAGNAVFADPGVCRIAHDLEQPGARVAAVVAVEVLQCAHHSLLDDIRRVGLVAADPAREIVRGRQMRQGHGLKPLCPCAIAWQHCLAPEHQDRCAARFIPDGTGFS